jgi:carbon-monoxide dehydrogenase large subunit
LGAKGAGEGGIVPVAAAVSNAVSAALAPLGAEVHELPLSPPRVWQLVQAAKAAGSKRQAVTPGVPASG